MKKIRYVYILLIAITFMRTTHSLEAKPANVSKVFRKIETEVSQIDSGMHNIIFKKNNDAYVIGYDGEGCLGYGKNNIKSKAIFTPSKIGENVTDIYASYDMVSYTKGKNIFFCGNGIDGEFYKNYKIYFTPTQYNSSIYYPNILKMWMDFGTMAYGNKNDLYFCGRLINPDNQRVHYKPKCILKNKMHQVKNVSISCNFAIINYNNGKADISGYNNDTCCIRNVSGWDNKFYKREPIRQFRSGVKKYIAGENNVAAIKKNGDFFIWGSNRDGLLCSKSLMKATYKPKFIMRNVKDVSMTYSGHILVLKKNGTVWAWGRNRDINNDYAYAISKRKKKIIRKPVKIASNVKSIATGGGFSVILKRNGTAYLRGTI